MFIHNINPVLFSMGPLSIRYYGLVYALGFLFIYFYLSRAAKYNKIKGLEEKDVDWLIIFLIIGVIVGARLFEVLYYNPSYYFHNPLDVFKVWQGGLSFHGAFVGIFFVAWRFCKKKTLNMFELLDTITLPVSIFLFFGRIANFINGELYGTITKVSWCVNFKNVGAGDVCRHPSQIYEALKNLGLFFILFFTGKYKKNRKPGFIFWLFVLLYGILRFLITFLRYEQVEDMIWIFSKGQWLCLIMIILGAVMLYRLNKQGNKQKDYKEQDKIEKKEEQNKSKKQKKVNEE